MKKSYSQATFAKCIYWMNKMFPVAVGIFQLNSANSILSSACTPDCFVFVLSSCVPNYILKISFLLCHGVLSVVIWYTPTCVEKILFCTDFFFFSSSELWVRFHSLTLGGTRNTVDLFLDFSRLPEWSFQTKLASKLAVKRFCSGN